MKTVAIVGSTGSIGLQALDVLAALSDEYKIVALAANKNTELIAEQVEKFQPQLVTLQDRKARTRLKSLLRTQKTKLIDCQDPVEAIVTEANADITLVSVVGAAGLLPSLRAAKLGKRLALANKEALVIGGDLLINACRKHSTELIPVDSEHSAIFQCLLGQDTKELKKIILTASGGPFLSIPKVKMEKASVKEALNHPNWKMGGKITIDSATMMNKGLEVIEAHHLFQLDYTGIEVIIHPQSLVHSLVEYNDGSLLAQLGLPDMRVPIQFAFSYPKRIKRKTSLSLIGKKLDFFEPDFDKFGCLRLAYEAGKSGKDRPIVLNAANEVAVESFLAQKIAFGSIYKIVAEALASFPESESATLTAKLETDKLARAYVLRLINSRRWTE